MKARQDNTSSSISGQIIRRLYSIGIRVYVLSIRIASVFLPKAKEWIIGRKTFPSADPQKAGLSPRIWFHCASLGEFEQGRPVMEALKKEFPDIFLLVSFFSPSGYRVRKNFKGADQIVYLPPDTPSASERFVFEMRPDTAVFIKYEFWYNYLAALSAESIPYFFISSVFRKEQPFFKWWGTWFKHHLESAQQIYVQDTASLDLLHSARINNCCLSGDTRYDRVASLVDDTTDLSSIIEFINGRKCIVAGSTWAPDEEILEAVYRELEGNVLIIAPHETNKSRINSIKERFGDDVLLYSQINPSKDLRVLVIDNVGMLSALYRLADIAYVGGAFGSGLHNILEPAAHGKAVIFGSQHQKFPEAADLINAGGGFSIKNKQEASLTIRTLFNNNSLRQDAGMKSLAFVRERVGATSIITEGLFNAIRNLSKSKSY